MWVALKWLVHWTIQCPYAMFFINHRNHAYFYIVSLTAVFSIVTQCSTGGALCDNLKDVYPNDANDASQHNMNRKIQLTCFTCSRRISDGHWRGYNNIVEFVTCN